MQPVLTGTASRTCGSWNRAGSERFRSRQAHYTTLSGNRFESELSEPPSYFNKEIRQSHYQMTWWELKRYIADLRQAGFDVARLSVQLQKKISFPLVAPIIILLAVPFSILVGTRGARGRVGARRGESPSSIGLPPALTEKPWARWDSCRRSWQRGLRIRSLDSLDYISS